MAQLINLSPNVTRSTPGATIRWKATADGNFTTIYYYLRKDGTIKKQGAIQGDVIEIVCEEEGKYVLSATVTSNADGSEVYYTSEPVYIYLKSKPNIEIYYLHTPKGESTYVEVEPYLISSDGEFKLEFTESNGASSGCKKCSTSIYRDQLENNSWTLKLTDSSKYALAYGYYSNGNTDTNNYLYIEKVGQGKTYTITAGVLQLNSANTQTIDFSIKKVSSTTIKSGDLYVLVNGVKKRLMVYEVDDYGNPIGNPIGHLVAK